MKTGNYLEGAIPPAGDIIKQYIEIGGYLQLTYGDLLDRGTSKYPQKIALISGETRLTYTELRERVDKFAIALLRFGIKKYDCIILQLPNRWEFVVAFYAMHRIGAVPILSIPRHDYREISFFFKLAQPVGWIVPVQEDKREFVSLINRIRSEFPGLKFLVMLENGEQVPSGALSMARLIDEVKLENYTTDYLKKYRPDPNDVAVLCPTGGTTGLPKMVPRTHNSLIITNKYISAAMSPDDIVLQATPVGHSMAMQGALNCAMFKGATLVLQRIPRPTEILETIQKEKVAHFGGVPTQLEGVVNHPNLSMYDVSSLRVIQTAGASLNPETARKAVEFFGRFGCQFAGSGLGASEGLLCLCKLDDPLEVKLSTIGRSVTPGSHYKVVDEGERELPPNTIGELVCKGPEVFTGYYKMTAQERQEVFTHDGYFKTGDLGKIDERGYITLTGRRKDVILRGGETLIPAEIEALVRQHAYVEQVAVIGMPDRYLGERICAYVTLKPEKRLTLGELVEFLKAQGASVLLLPERLEIVSELPLTPIGKVDKKALRKDIEGKLK